MAYFIFSKNNQLYRMAENQDVLNNFNIIQSDYNIIEDSQANFNSVKFGTKVINGVTNGVINYLETPVFYDKNLLSNYKSNLIYSLTLFTKNNPNHPYFTTFNNYLNQVTNLNIDDLTLPLRISLEQYFQNLGQPSFSPLQIP
jgi:hypothetical protein